MKPEHKQCLISGIISVMREETMKKNKKLCKENLFYDQVAFDAGDMLISLAFKSDSELNKIAKLCGL